MDYRHLGRSGLLVSPLCLGTMNFGPQTSEADSFAIMDRALDAGDQLLRHRERLRRRRDRDRSSAAGSRRAATAARRSCSPRRCTATSRASGRTTRKLSARHIRDACDASLRRLQTDHIDLYQMHHVDRATPWDEVWQAMDLLVAQGKVIYVGQLELRRLAHRGRQRGGATPQLVRPGLGAEPLQPQDAHDRARGDPGVRGLRRRGCCRGARWAAGCSAVRSARATAAARATA